ncbi:MAG: DEAD/DEAH box helicase [Waddliaceae bacterium]
MTVTIQPREYQIKALEAIILRQKGGILRQLVSLPTGTGKTILFGLLAKELNTKTLIIAHREQLIYQAVDKISMVWPGSETTSETSVSDKFLIGVCMAERNEISAQIVVATVQSASRPGRLEQLKECGFNLCVIDEAHHSGADNYKTLLQDLGFLDGNSDKLLVGVTATPMRKGGGLGDIFDEVVFERGIGTMIRAGYLSDLKGKRILTHTSLDGVSINNGDFTEYQLSEVCNTPERNALIADSFLEHCQDRKGIAFTCDVRHAIELAETFKQKGINASAIYGSMDVEEKRRILNEFSSGEIQILANCALLTEGYDQTDISAVLMCRPTRSQGLYIQCIGRGTRLHPGKTDCLVLDFCDNFHDIQSIANLSKAVVHDDEKREKTNDDEDFHVKKDPQRVNIDNEIIGDFDLLDRSKFAWTSVDEDWFIQLSPDVSVWIVKEEDNYIPQIKNETEAEFFANAVPLNYAFGICEDWLRKNSHLTFWSAKDALWRKESPTEKQIRTLKKMGRNPEGLTRGDASQLIGKRINSRTEWRRGPATSKQRYRLRTMGLKPSHSLTKGEASDLINQIKNKEEECAKRQ